MSRRRKQKNREKKERKADEQRVRISSSNLRSPIYQPELSERGYPSSLRFKADCQPLKEYMASQKTKPIPTTRKGLSTVKKLKGQAKLVPKGF